MMVSGGVVSRFRATRPTEGRCPRVFGEAYPVSCPRYRCPVHRARSAAGGRDAGEGVDRRPGVDVYREPVHADAEVRRPRCSARSTCTRQSSHQQVHRLPLVEPLFVPTSEPLVVEITIAAAKSSFGGGTSSDQTNAKPDVCVFLVRRIR